MKKLLLLLCLSLIDVSANAQYKSPLWTVFPIQDSAIVYTEVVKVDSTLTADVLYKNVKVWIVDAFASSKDVIQNQDDQNFILIGKGFAEEGHNTAVKYPKIWFTIKIECKDGRYKYTIYDFKYTFTIILTYPAYFKSDYDYNLLVEWGGTDLKKQKSVKPLEEFANRIDTDIKNLISSLKSSIIKKEETW